MRNISGDADFENTLLYTGREYDKEIGLYFYRARYYDPELGRFISQDPIGIEDDINLYTYVGNNPVNFTDPSGEKSKDIMIKGGSEANKRGVKFVEKYVSDDLQKMIIETGVHGMVHGANIFKTSMGKINEIFGKNYQDFNVTAYMLTHAVYGNGENLLFDNEHFISKELIMTNFYKKAITDAVNSALIKNSKNIDYTVKGITFGEGENDFANGFGTVNYSVKGKINSDGTIETHFQIIDEYIFYDLGDDTIVHNNIAWISQQNGLSVTPYIYQVDIYDIIQ